MTGCRVSVDTVLFRLGLARLQVLLLRRLRPPFAGWSSLPGGLLHPREELQAAAVRILRQRAGLDDVYLEQLFTFGDPARDPRGRVITVAHIALVPPATPLPAGDASWTPLHALPRLAFDHRRIVDYALQRLRGKIEYSPVGFRLLPEEFTLTEVQEAYEAVLGRVLDKRNFRKKLLSLKVLRPLGRARKVGAHRPARLYRFEDSRWEGVRDKGNVFVF